MKRDAKLSEDGRYRYDLMRWWGKHRKGDWAGISPREICVFVMLNPARADALKDDRTINRCIGFAKKFGFNALRVVNLFAFRSKDPTTLKAEKDPVGPENDAILRRLARKKYGKVIAAWGAKHLDGRQRQVLQLLRDVPVYCLDIATNGEPKHPVRLKADLPGKPYNECAKAHVRLVRRKGIMD